MPNDTIAELATRLLALDEGELTAREKAVIERAARRLAVSRNINLEFQQSFTFGQRVADRVAEIGGSWTFIIGFLAFVALWMLLNTWLALTRPLRSLSLHLPQPDPVPARRGAGAGHHHVAEPAGREGSARAPRHDYEVNLKAEIEIAALHDKLDQIRTRELAMLVETTCGPQASGLRAGLAEAHAGRAQPLAFIMSTKRANR